MEYNGRYLEPPREKSQTLNFHRIRNRLEKSSSKVGYPNHLGASRNYENLVSPKSAPLPRKMYENLRNSNLELDDELGFFMPASSTNDLRYASSKNELNNNLENELMKRSPPIRVTKRHSMKVVNGDNSEYSELRAIVRRIEQNNKHDDRRIRGVENGGGGGRSSSSNNTSFGGNFPESSNHLHHLWQVRKNR